MTFLLISRNFEDHLEGLLILNNKVGGQMEARYAKELEDEKNSLSFKKEEEEIESHMAMMDLIQ